MSKENIDLKAENRLIRNCIDEIEKIVHKHEGLRSNVLVGPLAGTSFNRISFSMGLQEISNKIKVLKESEKCE